MPKVIVSNTGPLISLEKLDDGCCFIRKLHSQIIVPHKVAEDMSEGSPSFEAYLEQGQIGDSSDTDCSLDKCYHPG